MLKGIKFIKNLIIAVTVITLFLVVYGFYTVPDEIYGISGENIRVNNLYTVTLSQSEMKRDVREGKYNVSVNLFNAIPVKNSSLTVSNRHYVVPSGEIFGLRLFTEGVLIIRTEAVDAQTGSVSPCDMAGLKKGDVILKVDGKEVVSSNALSEILSKGDKTSFRIEYERNGKKHNTVLNTYYSVSQCKYKAGMWIRDSAAGIGTMTFYDPKTGAFAGLGHGVCDVDTGEMLPFSDGDIVSANINGCYKGEKGKAGELCGVFSYETIGVIWSNNSKGVYGVMSKTDSHSKAIPIALSYEVEEGKAQIISTVDGSGPCRYDVEISKINADSAENKNMVIKITDEKLISKTGGIVQGMSGSPIIQNGKLIGAVTHVLVNDPTKGYGIFAQTMIETMSGLTN
ncbi:MAG: SpoIVB peptidase [Clostridia bacterium]|nr:SpoIVB peptidase [Clostridia bacterium]